MHRGVTHMVKVKLLTEQCCHRMKYITYEVQY